MSIGRYKNRRVSVVIPTYNERSTIIKCIESLKDQTYQRIEIIVVDDGSNDDTHSVAKTLSDKVHGMQVLKQIHKGPGEARNLGASHAKGEILVFVDADMTFDKDFIKNLVKPILDKEAIGTDSQDEYLGNPDNYWAKCWNLGRFAALAKYKGNPLKDITPDRGNFGGIFRAILKKEFDQVGGFEKGGDYTDDGSLAKKLGVKAVLTKGAIFYHYNPSTIIEVWQRASWIGAGRNFTDTFEKKLLNLVRFSLPVSIIKAIIVAVKYKYPKFVFFKLIYNTAVWVSVLKTIL